MPLVIMLTDDEKFLFKESLTVEETIKFSQDNARDIIAMGFDVKKTFIYSDFEYMGGHIYQNAIEFSKLLPTNQVRGAFGFDGTYVNSCLCDLGRNLMNACTAPTLAESSSLQYSVSQLLQRPTQKFLASRLRHRALRRPPQYLALSPWPSIKTRTSVCSAKTHIE